MCVGLIGRHSVVNDPFVLMTIQTQALRGCGFVVDMVEETVKQSHYGPLGYKSTWFMPANVMLLKACL